MFTKSLLPLIATAAAFLAFPAHAQTAKASIREWDLPKANTFPHDPLAAPDGSLWYSGFSANVLGRLDPNTGQFKEYALKTSGSAPHGLVADKTGHIWFTANSRGYIGKLDPETGEITEYPMPDAQANDPHTPIFDHKGILWFT